MFSHQKLRCYSKAIFVAKKVPALTKTWPRGCGYLIDQLRRAISSVALNIAEGNSRSTLRERGRFFCIARASAAEVSSIFDIASALDLISSSDYQELQNELLQIVKMLYKLR